MSEKLSELIPCPFCGGEPELITRGNAFTKKRSSEIRCTECNCLLVVGAIHQSLEWTAEAVSKKWNQRASSSALLGDAATKEKAASVYADMFSMLQEIYHETGRDGFTDRAGWHKQIEEILRRAAHE